MGLLFAVVPWILADAEAFRDGDDAERDPAARDLHIETAIHSAETAIPAIASAAHAGGLDASEALADLGALLRALRAFRAAITGADNDFMPLREVVRALRHYAQHAKAHFDSIGPFIVALAASTPPQPTLALRNELARLSLVALLADDFRRLDDARARTANREHLLPALRDRLSRACDEGLTACDGALAAIAEGGAHRLDRMKNPGAIAQELDLRVRLAAMRHALRSLKYAIGDPNGRTGDDLAELREARAWIGERLGELAIVLSSPPADTGDSGDGDKTPRRDAGSGVMSPAKRAEQPSPVLSWLGPALALRVKHPEWSDAKIADRVGVNKSTLSRNETYRKARQGRVASERTDTDDSHDPDRRPSRQSRDEEDADARLDREWNERNAQRIGKARKKNP